MKYKLIKHTSDKNKLDFWDRVNVVDNDRCWNWKLAPNSKGYGVFSVTKGKVCNYIASRYAYAITYGDPGSDLMVLHSCDNRICCNPAHLRTGNVVDNARDMTSRNRSNKGSLRPLSKLNEDQILIIDILWKKLSISQYRIAEMLNVNQSQISRAINRKRWKHVNESNI